MHADAATPFLQVHGLRWQPRGAPRPVVDGVDCTVGNGEWVGLLGANGSGKSSVLRALLGLCGAGCRGASLRGTPIGLGDARLRAQSGVVPQGPSLDGKLTAMENLLLGGRLFGLRGAAGAQAAAEALAQVGLAGRAGERAERLSGGQRRRLELARAGLHRPSAYLLDEPTQGLDRQAAQGFWQRLAAGPGRTRPSVLVATHDAEEAARCDRLLVLVRGQVVAEGTPAALLARVAADVLAIEPVDVAALPAMAEVLARLGNVSVRAERDRLLVHCAEGHTVVAPAVEAVGAHAIRALHLRRASLLDVVAALEPKAAERPEGVA